MNKNNLSRRILDTEEKILEEKLRPLEFEEFIGQKKVKENLKILIEAAKKRAEPLEHILIHGPSGLGKTTLAYIISKEMGADIKITSGAALEKAGDIAAILTNLNEGDIFFIDEAHRLNKLIEEIIYPSMENFKIDIVIGKGTSAKTIQIKLNRFTLIAATTRIALLSSPFRSRFGINLKLDFYTQKDIEKILERSAKILNIQPNSQAINILARASRFTPRIANRLLKRVRDLAQVKGVNIIDGKIAEEVLSLLDIDPIGLDATDRKILLTLIEKFKGGPAGLKSIAASIAEEEETIEDVYEPYLMQIGFLARTPRGRIATNLAFEHLGIKQRRFLI